MEQCIWFEIRRKW